MLLPRVLTAAIGIPLILTAIHLGGLSFLALVFAVSMFCLWEAFDLFAKIGPKPRRWLGMPLGALLFVVFILPAYSEPEFAPLLRNPFLAGIALTMASVLLSGAELFHVQSRSLLSSAVTLFAIIFVCWPLAHLALLRDLAPLGRQWCLFLFLNIWILDSAAYFTGRFLGTKKIAPRVSPKKTVEGFLGGILGAAAVSSLLWVLFFRSEGYSYVSIALLGGAGIGIIAQLSDLVESVLKREAKVKDSSDALPGHGGFLDRFDSYLLTTPLLYYGISILFP